MERLFGLAIMVEKYSPSRNLHDVLLPRSWVLTLWKDFIAFKGRTSAPLWVLAQSTETLLKDVYTGAYLRDTIKGLQVDSLSEFDKYVISVYPVTLCRQAGYPVQSGQLVQGPPTVVPTGPLHRPHVSIYFNLESSHWLMSSVNNKM